MRRLLLIALILAILSFERRVARAEEPLPRVKPLDPAAALRSFRCQLGFEMQLLAAEPLVTDPVAMDYDEHGRAFVCEMSDYPYTDKTTDKPFVERTMDLPIGRVRMLEDLDGDGCFDKSAMFAEGLSWPTGLAFWDGGVYVAATPDIWYFKDIDGDGKADVRRRVFTGFRKFNVQAVMNNLKWGLDGCIYGAGSSNGGTIAHADRPGEKPVVLGRHDFRFDPRTEKFELVSGGARFGLAFDDWGNRFLCNIRNPVQHVVLPSEYLARQPFLAVRSVLNDAAPAGDTLPVFRISPTETWRAVRARRFVLEPGQTNPRSETTPDGYFTSSSGITIYRGSAYPEEVRGNAFVGEVAANAIHRQRLIPDGPTFSAERADENCEFVASTDTWFRPVNFVNAPDGTLHVLDMYRETIEHPWSIPDDIKAQLDLESGRDRGRIYRLAPPGFIIPKPPRLGTASVEELVATLERPDSWWRETAQRLLVQRKELNAVPLLRRLVRDGRNDLGRIHALWTLRGLEQLDEESVTFAMKYAPAQSPRVREQAARLAEDFLVKEPSERLMTLIVGLNLATNDDRRLTFQQALTLGQLPEKRRLNEVTGHCYGDYGNEWSRAAILSSTSGIEAEVLSAMLRPVDDLHPTPIMLRELAFLVGAQNKSQELDLIAKTIATKHVERSELELRSALIGLGDGLKRSGSSLTKALTREEVRPVLATVFADSAKIARDENTSLEERESATRLLGHATLSDAMPVLTELLRPEVSSVLKAATVQTLSSFSDPSVSKPLVEAYRAAAPSVRAEIVLALLARPERIGPLLDAVEQNIIPVAQVPLVRRNLLLKHADAKVKDRATKLFSHDLPGPRKAVITEYQSALSLVPDRVRGRAVFTRECGTCHKLAGEGHDVGPNLETIRNRTPDELLIHILDPNREVAPNYLEYVVALKDGRTLTGVITGETAGSVTLRRPQGQEDVVLRSQIEELNSSGKSLMPEGVEKKVSTQDLADLLAHLLKR